MKNENDSNKLYKLGYINILDIYPSKFNDFEMCDIEEMKGAIKTFGLITPLSIIGPMDDGKYYIISGERRFRAMSLINKEEPGAYDTIPCYIFDKNIGETEQRLLIEVANVEQRDNVNMNEHRLKIVKLLFDLSEQDVLPANKIVDEAKKYMGMSVRYRRMYVSIFESGDKELQDMVSDGTLAVSIASRLVNADEEKRKEVIEDIKNGTPQNTAIKKITKENKNSLSDEKVSSISNDCNTESFETRSSSSGSDETGDENTGGGITIDIGDYIGDDVDIADLEEAFFDSYENSERVSSDIDSTGEIRKLKNETDTTRKTYDIITSWCSKMMVRTEFTKDERTVLEKMKTLLKSAGMI